MTGIYRIRIRGHVHDRWSGWFENFSIERQADGTTLLTGEIVDQAALHGVLARIRDLGVPLISVKQTSDLDCGSREGGADSTIPP